MIQATEHTLHASQWGSFEEPYDNQLVWETCSPGRPDKNL
jgi:hypothetical protein